MIDEKELRTLKNSILIVNAFTEQVHHITTAQDFMKIHNRNIETIIKIANFRESEYLKEKISNYPHLSVEEVKEYIKIGKKDLTFFDYFFGHVYFYAMRYMKTGSLTGRRIKLKMEKIRNLNKYVLEVIEDPYMENVYELVRKNDYL